MTKTATKRMMQNEAPGTGVCTAELSAFLSCAALNEMEMSACLPAYGSLLQCYDRHESEPDPIVVARRWQTQMKRNVLSYFSAARVAARTRGR